MERDDITVEEIEQDLMANILGAMIDNRGDDPNPKDWSTANQVYLSDTTKYKSSRSVANILARMVKEKTVETMKHGDKTYYRKVKPHENLPIKTD